MNAFNGTFDKYACFEDTIQAEVDGLAITATLIHDESMGPPWEEHDGHGPVSDWTNRDKLPGERVLYADRHGTKRYYNWQEAIEIARRDNWGFEDVANFKGTKGQIAEIAVQKDFEALKAWCNDEWHWCSVLLSVSKCGVLLEECAASLSGIECNYPGSDNSYLTEVANELLDEAVKRGKEALALLCS